MKIQSWNQRPDSTGIFSMQAGAAETAMSNGTGRVKGNPLPQSVPHPRPPTFQSSWNMCNLHYSHFSLPKGWRDVLKKQPEGQAVCHRMFFNGGRDAPLPVQ